MGERSVLTTVKRTEYQFTGWLNEYLTSITEHWLKTVPFSNPAILEMFRDRNRKPPRKLLSWSGEFAGKYLTSAVQVYRLTGDSQLRDIISDFVSRLISYQEKDGYLGPFPKGYQLTGWAPNVWDSGGHTWDAWGHYHIMLGLILWHEETGDMESLKCVIKMADLICRRFLRGKNRLVDTGSSEMNLAVIHTLCLLYHKTKTIRYLKMSQKIGDEFAATDKKGPLAGDYVNAALEGKEFHQTPRPRWESLHSIIGMIELYRITGDEKLRTAFEKWWWSIVKLDRHNNGGFSSGECAQGNPYHPSAIETCCTIAWIAMSVEMLKLTGNPVVADEIELSTLNSIVGLHSSSGRWTTYDTPMDGFRRASTQSIVFQAREGSPELNCCSVNGARGFGMISDWALMTDDKGIVLNYYGPSTISAEISSGITVKLVQETEYPVKGRIRLKVLPSKKMRFTLSLRVPYWSERSKISVNGQRVKDVTPAAYCVIEREWRRGDIVDINLDMRPHFWVGEKQCRRKTSMYRGPILLTYDNRFNDIDPESIPVLDATSIKGSQVKWKDWLPPMILMEYETLNGKILRLCDFGSAGESGSYYHSWLNISNVLKTRFTRLNPLRSGRPRISGKTKKR